MANSAVKIPQEFGNRNFRRCWSKEDEGMKVGRKIAWPRKRSGQLVAPLFRRVNGQPSTGHQPRLFIPFRPDVILLFGKGRLGGREWECGFAKIGTRTCLDFMTALHEFKRYERRIYSVIHWRNLYSINELRWIFMQISYYRMFPYYFTQMTMFRL